MDKSIILISINTSWNIYHFRAALVRALREDGFRLVSAAPADAYTARLSGIVDAHIDLPMDNAGTSPLKDALLFLRYLRVLRRVKPSVMLTYTIKPNIYGALAARMLGIPVIANVSGLGTAFIRQSWMTEVVKILYRMAFRGVSRVFFQNAEDRDLFLSMNLLPAEKAGLLPGSGIDLALFKPVERTRPPDAPVAFALIARLLRDKGVAEYVEAARIVKRAYPEVLFRLVGPRGVKNQTAIDDATLDAWIREGVIDYLGESDLVRAIIAAQDCVVLPSYREGLSRVLVEAAAMGKPLIASDVPGCRQVVEHGKNGFLCQPHDAKDLATVMQQFLALSAAERAAMGAESRAKAEREFDETCVINAYRAAIRAIIS